MTRFLDLIRGCSFRPNGVTSFDHQVRASRGEGSWVRTTLEVLGLKVKPNFQGTTPYLLTLELGEMVATDWNSGRAPNSSNNPLQLTLEIEGKEQALFSGMLGRTIKVLGYQPGWLQSLEALLQENSDLKYRLEEITFQLEQLGLISKDKIQTQRTLEP